MSKVPASPPDEVDAGAPAGAASAVSPVASSIGDGVGAVPVDGASLRTEGIPERAPPAEGPFFVASHDVLFQRDEGLRCDSCGQPIPLDEPDEGYDLPGAGVYLWARGTEVEREAAPLCASCASGIGAAALARWEIEEEEG
jgi:hypothetical protein